MYTNIHKPFLLSSRRSPSAVYQGLQPSLPADPLSSLVIVLCAVIRSTVISASPLRHKLRDEVG